MALISRPRMMQQSMTEGAGPLELVDAAEVRHGVTFDRFDAYPNGSRFQVIASMNDDWEELLVERQDEFLDIVEVLSSTDGGAKIDWLSGAKTITAGLLASSRLTMSKSPPPIEWLSTSSIRIKAGSCRSQTDSSDIVIPADIDLTGIALGASAERHVLAGIDGSGAPAAELSASVALPSGWRRYRRLGSIFTDPSGNIRRFTQIGDEFVFYNSIANLNGVSSVGAVEVFQPVTAPSGVPIIVHLMAHLISDATTSILISSPLIDDESVGSGNNTVRTAATGVSRPTADVSILTIDGTVRRRRGESDVSTQFTLRTRGYTDRRGRDL